MLSTLKGPLLPDMMRLGFLRTVEWTVTLPIVEVYVAQEVKKGKNWTCDFVGVFVGILLPGLEL